MSDPFNTWLQSRLTSHGFPVGAIDGVIGPATLKALRAFQASRGLEPTAIADPNTVTALRATSTGNTPRPVTSDSPAATKPRVSPWPSQSGVPAFYGAVGTNQTTIEAPYDMYLAWDMGTRVRRLTCHQKVAASASRVLQEVSGLYTAAERKSLGLDRFGGSLNVRKMRGGSSWSMHSWGIAFDWDPERNGLNVHAPQARLSHADAVPFWQVWESEGWLSLGRARNYDWMHVQATTL